MTIILTALVGLVWEVLAMAVPRKRRRKPGLRTLRYWRNAIVKPQAIGHGRKGVPYAVINSFQGIYMLWCLGKKWADRDIRRTKDGHFVVVHWMKDFKISVHDNVPDHIEEMTLAQVRALKSKRGHYEIHTLAEDFEVLGMYGIGAYIEPKTPYVFRGDDDIHYVRAQAAKYGVPLRGYALQANKRQVAIMRHGGIRNVHVLNK